MLVRLEEMKSLRSETDPSQETPRWMTVHAMVSVFVIVDESAGRMDPSWGRITLQTVKEKGRLVIPDDADAPPFNAAMPQK